MRKSLYLLVLLNCELLNDGEQPELEYKKIYCGTIAEQNRIFRYFERNFNRRENLTHERENNKTKNPCNPYVIHCSQSSRVMGWIYIGNLEACNSTCYLILSQLKLYEGNGSIWPPTDLTGTLFLRGIIAVLSILQQATHTC